MRLVTAAMATILVLALLGLGYILQRRAENTSFTPSPVTELVGIRLGATSLDVKNTYGDPETKSEPKGHGGLLRFDYNYPSRRLLVILVGKDENNAKAEIICTAQPHIDLLGINSRDSEGTVMDALGHPGVVSISKDGASKVISFPKWKAAFVFENGGVSEKCATTYGDMRFSEDGSGSQPMRAVRKGPRNQLAPGVSPSPEEEPTDHSAAIATTAETRPNSAQTGIGVDNAKLDTGSSFCAPNLDKTERLSRLANFGEVRQSAEETYEAGGHRIQFVLGGLVDCF